ncbi:MAG: TatD family hydrolase, partial [Eubacteriales bacterium]|nr:TatD family hydrolase [Eubacteriales bacterium]
MFDSHAHYDDPKFDNDRHELLKRLFTSGVTGIVTAGTDKDTSYASYELSKQYKNIYFTAGVYPEYAPTCGNFEEWLQPLLSTEKCVAIGEIGLDYHYDTPRDAQKTVFRRQLELASQYDMPVVVHNRDAHGDCLDIVLDFPGVRGVFHSFSGSAETAAELV